MHLWIMSNKIQNLSAVSTQQYVKVLQNSQYFKLIVQSHVNRTFLFLGLNEQKLTTGNRT